MSKTDGPPKKKSKTKKSLQCKKCNKPRVRGNYGFCDDHRDQTKKRTSTQIKVASDESNSDLSDLSDDDDSDVAEQSDGVPEAALSDEELSEEDDARNSVPALTAAQQRAAALLTELERLLHGTRVKNLRGCRIYTTLNNIQPLGHATRWQVQEFNICIEKNGQDVPADYFEQIMNWLTAIGAVSAVWCSERGKRLSLLHFHIILKAYAPSGAAGCTMIRHSIQSFFGDDVNPCRARTGYDVYVAKFKEGQTFDMMAGGYCTKDSGKPHFKLGVLNISRKQLAKGNVAWQKRKNSYSQTGFSITRANLFDKTYTLFSTYFRGLNHMSFIQCARLHLLKPVERHINHASWAQDRTGGRWTYAKTELLFAWARTVLELLPEAITVEGCAWIYFNMRLESPGVSQRCDHWLGAYGRPDGPVGTYVYMGTAVDRSNPALAASSDRGAAASAAAGESASDASAAAGGASAAPDFVIDISIPLALCRTSSPQ
jgi:hypothetical protein